MPKRVMTVDEIVEHIRKHEAPADGSLGDLAEHVMRLHYAMAGVLEYQLRDSIQKASPKGCGCPPWPHKGDECGTYWPGAPHPMLAMWRTRLKSPSPEAQEMRDDGL